MNKLILAIGLIVIVGGTHGYADTVKVCVTQDSTTDGWPVYRLFTKETMITAPLNILPHPGTCQNIQLNYPRKSLLHSNIRLELAPYPGLEFFVIGTVTFSGLINFKYCDISITYKDYTVFSFKAYTELDCAS